MKKYGIAAVVAVLILGGYIVWQRVQKPQRNEPIKIGTVLPLTGNNQFYGKEIQNAIELARGQINEGGGINGRLLKIEYEDDQADPKTGVAAVKKLIAEKVPVILGSWASGVVLATAPIAQENKTVMLTEAIAPAISQAGDYIFRIQPSATYYSSEAIRYIAKKTSLKKVAIIYINNEFGVALRDAVRRESRELNIQITTEEVYNQGDQDFRSQLIKIKASNPDVLFIGGYQEQAVVIRQAHELGLTAKILAGPAFENRKLVDDLGPLAEGVLYAYHFAAATTNPKTLEYEARYRQKFGKETGGFAPLMYDGVYIIAEALRVCGTSSDCIKNVLYQIKYDGISGHIEFDVNGDVHLPVIMKTVRNGQFVLVE